MASCNTFPTATNTVEVTTETLSTTISISVTTEPPTLITTTTTRPCPTTLTSGTCIPSTVTTVISSPGTTRTVTVPVTVPVPVTLTQVNTLYGSSCSNPPDNSPTPPPNTPNTPPPPTPTPTPTPTTYTSEVPIATSNGSTIVSTILVTSTQTPAPSNTVLHPPNNNKTSPSIGPIVGGVVGGFFGLIAIVALIWFLLKRRRRWDDIWDEDKDTVAPGGGRFSIDANTEPKPYEYGLVGTALAPQPASPPHSPPLGPTLPAVAGVLHPTHGRTPSMAPLLSTTNSHSSRPSTGGSTHPLQGFVPQPIPGQRRPSIENTGRPPSNGHTFATTSYTHSTMSNTTYPPAPMSVSNFSGTASNAGSSDLGRSGSPTSFAEPQRILQIANPHPGSSGNDSFRFSDPFSSSSAAAAAAAAAAASSSSSEPQRDGKGRIRRPSLTKAPIVHLDGGRVQQQLEAATAGAGPSIPQPQPQPQQHPLAPAPMPMQAGGGEPGPAPPAYEA